MKTFIFGCLVFLVIFCDSKKLPTTFKRCDVRKENFNQCLTEAVPNAIRQLKTSFKRVGLPSLDPLVIPAVYISPGPGVLNFQQNYTEMKLFGFTDISCSEVDLNFEENTMFMNCSTPQIALESDYYFNGSVSILPIYGSGVANITLNEVKCLHYFDLENYYQNGRKYLKVTNSTWKVDVGGVTYDFENLYNGENPLLSENVILVMNDNWKEIFDDLKPSLEEGFTLVFASLFNSLLSRVPVSDLFING